MPSGSSASRPKSKDEEGGLVGLQGRHMRESPPGPSPGESRCSPKVVQGLGADCFPACWQAALCPSPPPPSVMVPGEASGTAKAEPRATPPCSCGSIPPHPHPRGEILGQLASDSLASAQANSLEAAVIRREEGEGRGERRQARRETFSGRRRANYFKRIRFALVKLKTISFSVIKQIIAHQECWASLSPQDLLLLPGKAPRWAGRWGVSGEGAQSMGGDLVGGSLRRGRKKVWRD